MTTKYEKIRVKAMEIGLDVELLEAAEFQFLSFRADGHLLFGPIALGRAKNWLDGYIEGFLSQMDTGTCWARIDLGEDRSAG